MALRRPSTAESIREYGRGLAGGLLFSVPLLYTMEVWWAGFVMAPERMIVYLLAVFTLLLGYNRFAGMHHDASMAEVVIDSVEELGLGIVTAAAVLYLIGRIGPGFSFDESLGKIVVEAGLVAIGYSVGTAQLGGDEEGATERRKAASFSGQLVIAFCGAVLIAANVAPTEEILIIAFESSPLRIAGLALFSLFLAATVLFFSSFRQARRVARADTPVEGIAGSVVTYAVALIASAAILWFFGRFDGLAPALCLRQTVVLALPGVLGSSAGRLLLQT